MDKKTARTSLIFGAIAIVILVGYTLTKSKSTASSGGGQIAGGYDPSGGVSISNVGGSNGTNGTLLGNNIANTYGGNTPIQFDVASGGVINAITRQVVNPSSWQGTTNKSGSITYLNGQLAGEGSGSLALQPVTY